KRVEARGDVLTLGAPLGTITLLCYAENRARMRDKRVLRYPCPVLREGKGVWVELEDCDTGEPHADYTFEEIARVYLALGEGRRGAPGNAQTSLRGGGPERLCDQLARSALRRDELSGAGAIIPGSGRAHPAGRSGSRRRPAVGRSTAQA